MPRFCAAFNFSDSADREKDKPQITDFPQFLKIAAKKS